MSYSTKQRKLILNLLKEQKDRHLTAEEIVSALKADGELVGKATVYRYLDLLLESGMVRKYTAESRTSAPGGACYQLICRDVCREHFHLKCGDCGKLFHIECDYLSDIETHVKSDHDFNIDNTKTVFYGRCHDCDAENSCEAAYGND
ncbi:MAG: transcriptional repressor [Oscillospiraceae bacterium]|nr:transcriptional repressor [Oscillospiraceae bacterium]